MSNIELERGGTVIHWLAGPPYCAEVQGSIPGPGLAVWNLHVLPLPTQVFSGYSGFFSHSKKNEHGRLIEHSISSLGGSVRVNGHLG